MGRPTVAHRSIQTIPLTRLLQVLCVFEGHDVSIDYERLDPQLEHLALVVLAIGRKKGQIKPWKGLGFRLKTSLQNKAPIYAKIKVPINSPSSNYSSVV